MLHLPEVPALLVA